MREGEEAWPFVLPDPFLNARIPVEAAPQPRGLATPTPHAGRSQIDSLRATLSCANGGVFWRPATWPTACLGDSAPQETHTTHTTTSHESAQAHPHNQVRACAVSHGHGQHKATVSSAKARRGRAPGEQRPSVAGERGERAKRRISETARRHQRTRRRPPTPPPLQSDVAPDSRDQGRPTGHRDVLGRWLRHAVSRTNGRRGREGLMEAAQLFMPAVRLLSQGPRGSLRGPRSSWMPSSSSSRPRGSLERPRGHAAPREGHPSRHEGLLMRLHVGSCTRSRAAASARPPREAAAPPPRGDPQALLTGPRRSRRARR